MSTERHQGRSRLASALHGFRRERSGATALEFALVAGPFLFALFATMEVAMVLWSGEVLEKAVASASRKIHTGEFQTNSAYATKTNSDLQELVRQSICTEASVLINCNDIKVDVRDFSSFAGATPPNPVTSAKVFDASGFGYKPIAAKQIGLVTAALEYKTFFPPIAMGTLANGNRAIIATAAFRAEPYTN